MKLEQENSAISLRVAEALVIGTLGNEAKMFAAQDTGSYVGPIIGQTDCHVLQQLTARSAVAHLKEALSDIPASGINVQISYSGGKAAVRALRKSAKAQTAWPFGIAI